MVRQSDSSAGTTSAPDSVLDRRLPDRPAAGGAVVEAPLGESELFDALMDNLPDHIYFKDRQSRFLRINKALARHLGLKDCTEAIGRTDRDFFGVRHADAAMADERRIMDAGISVVAKEEEETWPDGRKTWVSTTKAPLRDQEGNITGTIGISRDITRIKQSEREYQVLETRLQQAEKMDSLGMLASGIAHDFNNLLTGVLGGASVAIASLKPDDPVVSTVKDIETAALRAADLSNQLLAYAGRGGGATQPVDLVALTREMGHLLEVAISRNVTLRYDFAENIPGIEADPTQIRQVIMNLIINAAAAIGTREGTISVRIGVTDFDAGYLMQVSAPASLQPGRYVVFEAEDNGCGMTPEVKDRIFDPFFTTKQTGKGLGLAVVLGIVRGHKGFIKVHSELGIGTTFKVFFKASERPTVVRAREHRAPPWRGSGTVLVVDDEELVCRVSGQMVQCMGFDAISTTSSLTALELFRQHKDKIALVLLDEVMPHLGGAEVFAELRRIKPDIKVVLCSGYSERDAMGRFGLTGLAGFVQKPFTVQILSDKLKMALEKG